MEGYKNLEIVVGSHSSVQKSPKKFCIDNEKIQLQCDEGDAVKVKSLDEIVQLAVHHRITLEGKVQSVEKIEKVKARGTMLDKQDVAIADATAAWRCVVWEKDMNKLKEDYSYRLINVTIRTFNGSKYLSLSEKSYIEEITDIGDVVDEGATMGEGSIKIVKKGEIVGVMNIEVHNSCRVCKAKVMAVNDMMGECSKCGMKVKMNKCSKSKVTRFTVGDQKKLT